MIKPIENVGTLFETTRARDTQNNLNVFPPTPMDAFVANGTQHLVHSLAFGGLDSSEQPPPPASIIPWNLDLLQADDFSFDTTEDQVAATRRVAAELNEFLNAARDEDSENEQDVEWAAEDLEPEVVPEPTGIFYDGDPETEPTDTQPRKRPRTSLGDSAATARHWYPWSDRITCTLDILMHLPRSVFSHRQLDLFLWLLRVNGVEDVPSVKKMIKLNADLQKACGVETLEYNGALGHKYYMNSLSDIISQEMANPQVRPHLSFYPEDSGKRLSEARQASRWLHDAPDDQLTPMIRLGSQDYFIYEPLKVVPPVVVLGEMRADCTVS
ncbi:hypothetical protein ONZ45_g1372 [Pleurotus djamor]|nr:hypothetical protein ONZ45_g1372 [Pleurotus djamor]